MNNLVYADNAATTQLDIDAFTAMQTYLLNEYGNASQPYSFGRKAKLAVKKAREQIALNIGANNDEIYFTSCGSESNNWVIKGFSRQGGKRLIVTSCIEHHAILKACDAESINAKTVKLPVNKYGEVSCADLDKMLSYELTQCDYDGVLVSVMTANNEIGTIQPIRELAQIAHSHGALFHTDAVQAVGHIKIDVKELDVDFLSASAHKFNGPKGIGFLYIKHGAFLRSLIDGGSQENGARAGTENVASIVGMSVALNNNIEKLDENAIHIKLLENRLIERLDASKLDYVRNGSDNHIPGNINLSFKNSDGEMILHRLDLRGICISTGSACDSVNTQLSHVIQAICVGDDYAHGTIRISLGKNNTVEDVDVIVDELGKILTP